MKAALWMTIFLVLVMPFQAIPAATGPYVIAVDGLSGKETSPRWLEWLTKNFWRQGEVEKGYLAKELNKSPEIGQSGAEIHAFLWSRDPGDSSRVIGQLTDKIQVVYRQTGGKRPLVIIAHSWGTVLSYAALHALRGDVTVNGFISLGSPLNASPLSLEKGFLTLETLKEFLPPELLFNNLKKPVSLKGPWFNFFAENDLYSSKIGPAENYQIDQGAGSGALRVIQAPETEKYHREYYTNPAILNRISDILIAQTHGKIKGLGKIGPEAVFRPNPEVYQEYHREYRKVFPEYRKGGGDTISVMRKLAASPQAIAFAQANEDNFFLTKFIKFGAVDLGVCEADDYFVFANPHGDYYYLVNGSPQIIAIKDIRYLERLGLDDNNPWSRSNPPGTMSFKYTKFEKQVTRPEGGQRFIFGFPIYKGSHAGGIYGYVPVAYDFDSSGQFLGTKMLGFAGAGN